MTWLSEIEEREKLASEAPWVIHLDCLAHPVQVAEDEWEVEQLSEYIEGGENRDFIVNARNDVPRMARVLRELGEGVELFHKAITKDMCDDIVKDVGRQYFINLSDDAKELCVAAREENI